jgi:flagellar hook-associated protein 3 FlgL
MTTIGKSMFPLKSSYQHISAMKARYDKLQGQLATGQRAGNLAEMGSDRFFALSMRARMSRIEAYSNAMTSVNLRTDVLDSVMSRLEKIEADQRTSAVPGGYGSSNVNFEITPTTSRVRLEEVLDLLNSNVGGRYLFSGGLSDKKAVATSAALINGEVGRAGFKTVAGERKLADAGVGGMGRLDITTTANLVELGEDGAHPFGLKLSTLSSSSAAVALTPPTGIPAVLGVQFGATPPVEGSTVTMGFTLPDGTEESITLTAVTGTPRKGEYQLGVAAPGTTMATAASVATAAGTLTINGENFAIGIGDDATAIAALINGNALVGVTASVGTGADAGRLILTGNTPTTDVDVTATVAGIGIAAANYAATTPTENTAANFASALGISIQHLVDTKLAAASTYAAAENFFNGQGQQVLRVDGPPFETATALVAGTPTNTVFWYSGEDSADPRNTVNAKVDDGTVVRYGVQANERGFVELVRSLAAMSIETFPSSDPTSSERFDAMASRQMARLSEGHNNDKGSIEVVAVELALAKVTMANVSTRQTAYKSQLQTMLAEIETIPPEEVAMELLALQTRLEASFETTALVARLSLVHYLPR